MLLRMIGVLGCGVAGGFLGWVVALFRAPMDLDGLTYMATSISIGTVAGLGTGLAVLS